MKRAWIFKGFILFLCFVLLSQFNMYGVEIKNNFLFTGTVTKNLLLPTVHEKITTATRKLTGSYDVDGATIIFEGNGVTQKTMVRNGKFSIRIPKLELGSKAYLTAQKFGYEDSKTNVLDVNLQKPTFSLVSMYSNGVDGQAYPKSIVKIFLDKDKIGDVQADSKGNFSFDFPENPGQGKFLSIVTEFDKYKSYSGYYIGYSWGTALDSFGKLHRLTENTDVKPMSDEVKKLLDYVIAKGGKPIVIMTPPSVIAEKTQLLHGAKDYSNSLVDRFLKQNQNNGFQTMDLRKSFSEAGLYNNSVYFKYDHHWSTQSSFYAYRFITKELEKQFDLELDPEGRFTNSDNYNFVLYKNYYRGSIAFNKIENTGYEDFTKIYPKFDTDVTVSHYGDKKELLHRDKGRFEDALIKEDLIYKGGPCYLSYLSYYMNYSHQVEIENHKAFNDLSVMLLTSSAGAPVAAFMSSSFKRVSYIDLQPTKFHRSVYDYVNEFKPDIFIFMYTPHTFGKKSVWDFDMG